MEAHNAHQLLKRTLAHTTTARWTVYLALGLLGLFVLPPVVEGCRPAVVRLPLPPALAVLNVWATWINNVLAALNAAQLTAFGIGACGTAPRIRAKTAV